MSTDSMAPAKPPTATQLQCIKQGGPMEIVEVPYPSTPAAGEVLVRNKVVAFNLIDTKQRDFAMLNDKFPQVLGLEGGGVVEAIGEGVEDVKVGDDVAGWESEAFQEIVIVKRGMLFKRPSNLSLVEAASMPDCFVTAVSALVTALKIPLPFLECLPVEGDVPSSVLVLGGASAVGANCVQLLRVAYPSLHILATASPRHHAHALSLGASKVVDYRSSTVVADLKAASPNGAGVDVIVDCVSAGASQMDICDVFDEAGSKKYSQVVTGTDVSVPDGVTRIIASAEFAFRGPGGLGIIPALTKLVEEGTYKPPLPVRVVGHGLSELADCLDEVKRASCEKLVLTL